jgi:hypothetical protein
LTPRAVILGLLGAAFVAGIGYLNDSVLRLTLFVGNHFPISVFGILILTAIIANPVLYRLRAGWRLRPAELAVAVALMLVACCIPGSGMMRSFMQDLALPMAYNENSPGWKKFAVLRYTPQAMRPGHGDRDEEVMNGFLNRSGQRTISLSEVPWAPWSQALTTWMTITGLLAIAVICLSLIVHRQWASRERLQYPIATFATALMAKDGEKGVAGVLRGKLFWIGLGVVLAIRVVNGIYAWYNDSLEIPLKFSFEAITQKWPKLWQAPSHTWALVNPTLYPTVIAFSFLLASDVSLSLGLSQIIAPMVGLSLLLNGVDITSDWMTGGMMNWQLFGSYLGIAVLLLYIGRRHYWQVLKQAIVFRRQEGVEGYAAWACRILLLSVAGLVILLSCLGLDWPFALGGVMLMLLLFLVIARMNAESGLFFVQANWQPISVLIGLFGGYAMGPQAIVIIGLLTVILTLDPRECLMPFVVNGLKMCENTGVRPARVGGGAVVAFAIAMAVAVPVVFWANYNYSDPQKDAWAYQNMPKFTYDAAERIMQDLSSRNQLEQSLALGTWDRLMSTHPDPRFLWSAGVGLALALSFSLLRLRFTWWPLHPIIFLVWGTYPMANFSHSFLLGWFIKVLVTKFGGGRTYRQVMGLMFGIIAGDMLGGLTFQIVGASYYAVMGLDPKSYMIFPS